MKTYILKVLLIFFIISSCNVEEDRIEIYLPKKRIEVKEGIPIEDAFKNFDDAKEALELYKNKNVRYDTIKKEWIFCGKFEVDLNDLQHEPFLSNKEILGFDLKKSLIKISESGVKKISQLEPNPKNQIGHQFVICINKKPKIHGYFINSYSPYWSTTYSVFYHYNYVANKNNSDYSYIFRFGKSCRALDTINERELMKVFVKSNRILK